MYFSTFHSYNENDDVPLPEEKICIICWEKSGDIKGLKCIMKYSQNCECNGTFHLECLTIWINKNNRCPICREKLNTHVILNEFDSNEFDHFPYIVSYMLTGLRYFRSLTMLCLIYLGFCFVYYTVSKLI